MKKIMTISIVALAFVACADKAKKTEVAPPPPPVPTKAQAILKAAKGTKVEGTIVFTVVDGKMNIESNVSNLKKGAHGFHIHETGDCTAADFSSAGGHFNPTAQEHADVTATARHAGDLGNLVADKKKKAQSTITVEGLSMSGSESIIGKAVVIHKNKDDGKSQPSGKSGDRIACGVIEVVEDAPAAGAVDSTAPAE